MRDAGGAVKDSFETLNRRQSPPNLVFREFAGLHSAGVVASLAILRQLGRGARLPDWRAALQPADAAGSAVQP